MFFISEVCSILQFFRSLYSGGSAGVHRQLFITCLGWKRVGALLKSPGRWFGIGHMRRYLWDRGTFWHRRHRRGVYLEILLCLHWREIFWLGRYRLGVRKIPNLSLVKFARGRTRDFWVNYYYYYFFYFRTLRVTLVCIKSNVSCCTEWIDLGKGRGGLRSRPGLEGIVVGEPKPIPRRFLSF